MKKDNHILLSVDNDTLKDLETLSQRLYINKTQLICAILKDNLKDLLKRYNKPLTFAKATQEKEVL